MLTDEPPTYSPLVPVIIEKCIRLLKSNSGSFKLYEKTMVSLYVCNSLIYLLQSQVCVLDLRFYTFFLMFGGFEI